MKLLSFFVALLIVLISSVGVSAGDSLKIIGEVLYHQDFSDESDLTDSGIHIGTQSSVNSMLDCAGDTLHIKTYDKGRVYAILPQFEKDSTYTAEFSFRFTEVRAENGFISMILTCRGDEPTNISGLVIRADGTIDDFGTPSETIMNAIRNGETVNVQIPIRENVLNEVILTVGEEQCTVERESVLVLGDGQMGFSVRNVNVEVPEVYVVHGVDYTEKLGYYADFSYSVDGDSVVTVGPSSAAGEAAENSPDTSDAAVLILAVTAVTGMTLARRNSAR